MSKPTLKQFVRVMVTILLLLPTRTMLLQPTIIHRHSFLLSDAYCWSATCLRQGQSHPRYDHALPLYALCEGIRKRVNDVNSHPFTLLPENNHACTPTCSR